MLKLKSFLLVAVASMLLASPSLAALELMDHASTGSIVSTPWLAEGHRTTITTLTNALAQTVTVHVTALDSQWQPLDFDCQLSPMETTYFVFETNGSNGSKITSECSDVSQSNLNIVQTRFIPGQQNGFVVFHMTAGAGVPPNPTDNGVSLIADFTVIDFDQGYAFSANGWHFQTQGATQNNTLQTPPTLATSFIAPDDDVTAELLLYTLHGRAGWNSPVKFGGLAYDDDEQPLSNVHEYDCFTIVSLQDIFGAQHRSPKRSGRLPVLRRPREPLRAHPPLGLRPGHGFLRSVPVHVGGLHRPDHRQRRRLERQPELGPDSNELR